MKYPRLNNLWAAGFVLVLAGAAIAQEEAPSGETKRTVAANGITLPTERSMPSADEIYAAWPADAKRLGLEGSARVRCVIDKQGVPRDCSVETEAYPGMRFGSSAMALAQKGRFDPALDKDGRPLDFSMPFTFTFTCRDRCMRLDPETLKRPLAVRVVWETAPTADEVQAAFPAEAAQSGIPGDAILSCQFTSDNRLGSCQVGFEQPNGMGYGQAAMKLAPRFKAKTPAGQKMSGFEVRVPFHFEMKSGRLANGAPEVIRGPSTEEFRAAFPSSAASETGLAQLACAVSAAGLLDGCSVMSETPAGQGFGAAAVAVSSKFTFNLWTPDGLPATGSRVAVPVQFNRAPPALKGMPARLETPGWTQKPTDAQMAKAYPDKAMRLAREGGAVLDCVVQSSAEVVQCKIISESPTGLGFGAAALSVTQYFRIRPLQVDGAPVVPTGTHVTVPVQFKVQ